MTVNQRHHLTDTGPKPCNAASPETCPKKFNGQDSPHFENLGEAQAAFDRSKAHLVHTRLVKPRHNTPIALSSMMDLELLNRMVAENYVRVQSHPDDPSLKVMTYTQHAQFEGKWNDVTKQARGLIIRSNSADFSDAETEERPFRKFYTLQQMESGWSLGDEEDGASSSAQNEMDRLDFDAPAEVTDKRDGSMGILYTAPDGKLALATKGSFQSDQAKYYTAMLRKDGQLREATTELRTQHPGKTFIFEMTGDKNQIVVYYDHDEISMIGVVDKKTGLYHSTRDFTDTWNGERGLTIAEPMPANSLREALMLPNRQNREGVVVRIKADKAEDQMMVKVKQDDYLKLHRVLTHMNPRRVFELARDGGYEEATAQLHNSSFFNGAAAGSYDDLHKSFRDTFTERKIQLDKEYQEISHIQDRREFAMAAQKTSNPSYMFSSKDGKDTTKMLWGSLEKEFQKNGAFASNNPEDGE